MSQISDNQVGELNVKIDGDVKPLVEALDDAKAKTEQAATNIGRDTEQVSSAFGRVNKTVTAFRSVLTAVLGPIAAVVAAATLLAKVINTVSAAFESGESRAKKFLSTLSSDSSSAGSRLSQINDQIAKLNSQMAANEQSLFSRFANLTTFSTTSKLKKEIESLRDTETALFRATVVRENEAIRSQSRERAKSLEREAAMVEARLADETGIAQIRLQAEHQIEDLRAAFRDAATVEEENAIRTRANSIAKERDASIQRILDEAEARRRADEEREKNLREEEERRQAAAIEADAERIRKLEIADSRRQAKLMEADAERARRLEQALEDAAASFGVSLEQGVNSAMGRITVSVEQIANRVEQLVVQQRR